MITTPSTTPPEPSIISSNQFVCLVAVFPLVLAALLSGVIHASIPFNYIDADTAFASVTAPLNKSSVKGPYTATGTIKQAPKNGNLYLVEESEGNYYPKKPITNAPGHWRQDLYAGAPGGTEFRLLVISVDTNDSSVINNWFINGESTGNYPGISSLTSVEELTAVTLVVAQ